MSKYLKMVEELNKASALYHAGKDSTMSDTKWDITYAALKLIEENHPELIVPESPTQRVGEKPTTTSNISKHHKPLLSLGNVFNEEEVMKWVSTIGGAAMVVENKYDGLALALTYFRRNLIKAVTRGDGHFGEDVTNAVVLTTNVPLTLSDNYPDGYIEIYGECYMHKATLEEINAPRIDAAANGVVALSPYSNARNAAAGIIRRKDPAKDWWDLPSKKLLCFTPYGADERLTNRLENHFQLMDLFAESFDLPDCGTWVETHTDLIELLAEKEQKRDSYPFEVDGAVIKVGTIAKRVEMGERTREPRWATAYKFAATVSQTTLKDVIWQVGRTGRITPVAIVDEVMLSGAKVTRCTLHNLNIIKQLGVGIGDTVNIVRSGEVIPKILSVAVKGKGPLIKPPLSCPICTKHTYVTAEDVYCKNASCNSRLLNTLVRFASRERMDIKGLGPAILQDLLNAKMVVNYCDIFKIPTMDRQKIMEVSSLADKGLDNLISEIKAKSTVEFYRFLGSLGIGNIGNTTSKLMAETLVSPEKLKGDLDNSVDEVIARLEKIKGIGPVVIEQLVDYFMSDKYLEYQTAKEHGLVVVPTNQIVKGNSMEGMTFVITGKFEHATRDQIKEALENQGAKVTGKVTAKTTALIRGGHEMSSKYKDALNHGVRIDTFDTPGGPQLMLSGLRELGKV